MLALMLRLVSVSVLTLGLVLASGLVLGWSGSVEFCARHWKTASGTPSDQEGALSGSTRKEAFSSYFLRLQQAPCRWTATSPCDQSVRC